MMWWSDGSWGWAGWLAMSLMMVVFWGLIGFGIYWLVRSTRTPSEHPHTHASGPEDILAERFARGEISPEEFDERKKVLSHR